jgi:hypothetical protein
MVYVPRFATADVGDEPAAVADEDDPDDGGDEPGDVDDFDELHPAATMRIPVAATMSFLVLLRNVVPSLAGS